MLVIQPTRAGHDLSRRRIPNYARRAHCHILTERTVILPGLKAEVGAKHRVEWTGRVLGMPVTRHLRADESGTAVELAASGGREGHEHKNGNNALCP
jgi:hypothetical protein